MTAANNLEPTVPLVRARGIVKDFPGVRALDQVDFELRPGEVHVLLGENGAGKSTLVKIIAGLYSPTVGDLELCGQPVTLRGLRDGQRRGVAMLPQELNLIPQLSVARNVFLGQESRAGDLPISLNDRQLEKEAKRLLSELDVSVDPRVPVEALGVAEQQMVAIARALSRNAQVLIMDEPTGVLTGREITHLFDRVRLLKERGVGIIYISHRLAEVHEISDRVTVLRDGRKIGTYNTKEVTVPELVRLMVGRPVSQLFPRTFQNPGAEALRIEGLTGSFLRGISLTVRCGEIVGLAGLVGAGRTTLARTVFGLEPRAAGTIQVLGRDATGKSPEGVIRMGAGLLPEDRKTQGLALCLSVGHNVVLAGLLRLFPRFMIDFRKEQREVASYIDALHVAVSSPQRLARYLSGGNQQKVVLAKWLCSKVRLFIFDEPTRGIDVGAKAEVHRLMDELVKDGAAILMISSELPEVLRMSDRVYVMQKGQIVEHYSRQDATEEKVVTAMLGAPEVSAEAGT